MPETEADTCRKLILPKLYGAGWTDDQISEQYLFTDGRVIPNSIPIKNGIGDRVAPLARAVCNLTSVRSRLIRRG
jgi:type I site-specific restriction endonuclease